jgi:tRNA-specific 2-thiouridylase
LDRDSFMVDRCNWIPFEQPEGEIQATVKIRYNHPGTAATITPLENNRAEIKLHVPQRAVTPGQAAVFYHDDLVLGGGWIMAHQKRGANSARAGTEVLANTVG